MTPPTWACVLLRTVAPAGRAEEVIGDLEEAHRNRRLRRGPIAASLLTSLEALDMAAALVRHRIRPPIPAPPGEAKTLQPRDPRSLGGLSWPGFLDTVLQDVRFAWRGLLRHKTFATVAAVTIAVGIGATTVAMSIANGVLLQSPPIPEPDRMAAIWEFREINAYEGVEGRLIEYKRYEAYRDGSADVFDGLAAHSYAHLSIATDQGAVVVEGFLTSGNYFTVLQLPPALGRLYSGDHETTAVISERLWQSRFGGDPGVVGQPISINSRTFTLAGVARSGFVGTMSTFTGDVWIPALAYADMAAVDEDFSDLPTVGARPSLVVPIGRLRDGLSFEQASARISDIAKIVRAEEDARFRVRGARLEDIRWRTDLMQFVGAGLGTLVGAAVMLLLIACANIAGLVMARSYARQREVAVRMAIGAGRMRIIRQMVTENLFLFLAGGVGGALLAWVGSRAIASIEMPLDATITLDTTAGFRVLAGGVALAALLGLLFGLAPAGQASRQDLTTSLKEGGQPGGRSRARGFFVVGQIAVATLLLIVAGLTTRSFLRVLDVELGLDPERVLVATLDVASHGYDEARGRAFYDQLLERVGAIPGVAGASLAEFVPLRGASASNGARVVDGGEDAPSIGVYRNVVDPEYSVVNRIALLSGRFITDEDQAESQPVAVINQTLAERMWPGLDPLGRRFRSGGREYEVVGVAQNGVYSFTFEEPKPFAYYAATQRYRPGQSLHVRAADLTAVAAELHSIVRDLDPNVALQAVAPMSEVVSGNRFLPRFMANLTVVFALVGLLLAALGVYGMLSVHVAQRKREFGIRLALGAQARQVLGLVVGRGAVLAGIGCGIGLIAAFGTARLLSSLLFGIRPFDWVTFVSVPVLLVGTAVVASLRPARQATTVDPRTALQDV